LEFRLRVSLFCEAVAAVYRSVVRGLEGNLSFAAAFSANCGEHFSGSLGSLFSCVSASLAALGFVLEAAFSVEFLFACGKNEFVAAIFAGESLVFVHLVVLLFE
jgi:hypothetical protein